MHQVQIWLQEGDELRRPLSGKRYSVDEFAERAKDDIRYIVYVHVGGSYSNGTGGRAVWRCSTKKHIKELNAIPY